MIKSHAEGTLPKSRASRVKRTSGSDYNFDNNWSCIAWVVEEGKNKQVDLRYHTCPKLAENDEARIVYCRTERIESNVFTKPAERANLIIALF